jgi:hypothetical protein
VFSDPARKAFFANDLDLAVNAMRNADWHEGNYVSIEANVQNEFVIVLNEAHLRVWQDYLMQEVQSSLEKADRQGFRLFVGEHYETLEYRADSKLADSVSWDVIIMIQACGLLQILNGVPPEEWSLTVTLRNIDTGHLVWEGVLPSNTPSVSIAPDDWDV